jgi:hypothetical protein
VHSHNMCGGFLFRSKLLNDDINFYSQFTYHGAILLVNILHTLLYPFSLANFFIFNCNSHSQSILKMWKWMTVGGKGTNNFFRSFFLLNIYSNRNFLLCSCKCFSHSTIKFPLGPWNWYFFSSIAHSWGKFM